MKKKISLFLDDLFLPAKKKKNDVQPASKFDDIKVSKLQESDIWDGKSNLRLQKASCFTAQMRK